MTHNGPYVTTVIVAPDGDDLQEKSLMAVDGISHLEWLDGQHVCDLYHNSDALDLSTLRALPVDCITQPLAGRRKKLLISDMDSTLIEQECIDELADYLGIKDQVSDITERAMNGELDFADALRARVALLKDLPQHALEEVYATHITLMPGARELVATMKAQNAYCLLVSGGFTFFTAKVRDELGFDADQSNQLEFIGGKLSGQVVAPILDKEAKLQALNSQCSALNITPQAVLAVGDGANDLPMLQAAGMGVAYHAKPIVQQQTNAAVTHNDLSALLFIQGYKREDWAL